MVFRKDNTYQETFNFVLNNLVNSNTDAVKIICNVSA